MYIKPGALVLFITLFPTHTAGKKAKVYLVKTEGKNSPNHKDKGKLYMIKTESNKGKTHKTNHIKTGYDYADEKKATTSNSDGDKKNIIQDINWVNINESKLVVESGDIQTNQTIKKIKLNETEVTKKKRSAIIASLLVTNKAKVENHVEFCPPKSLETWKKKKGKDGTENIPESKCNKGDVKDTESQKSAVKDETGEKLETALDEHVPESSHGGAETAGGDSDLPSSETALDDGVALRIPEPVPESSHGRAETARDESDLPSSEAVDYWDDLDKQLQKDKLLSHFPRGTIPSDFDNLFHTTVKKFAKKYLLKEKVDNLAAKIAFFVDHERVNKKLLNSAVTWTILKREDFSNDIPNPLQVDNGEVQTNSSSGDYQLSMPVIRSGELNLIQYPNEQGGSKDPDEAKLDYYREDSMFHVFHQLLHKTPTGGNPRHAEQFWYAHQQMMRRYALERLSVGVPPVVPLDPYQQKKTLGLGYKVGFYHESYVGRKDYCTLPNFASKELEKLELNLKQNRYHTFEDFGRALEGDLHGRGHEKLAFSCRDFCPQAKKIFSNECAGVMHDSTTSAREPTFFRWHTHMENIVQQFRNEKFPKYNKRDFLLSDDITVEGVRTVLNGDVLQTPNEISNTLITYMEQANIAWHNRYSRIIYNRLNHKDFRYLIQIRNPRRLRKKVFIRLWLGILHDANIISSYDQKYMIEMDQFALWLSGDESEVININSKDSRATMKAKERDTVYRLFNDIKEKRERDTWCGFPHHLLLPRSKDYNPTEETLGGEYFVVYAFVTDTARDELNYTPAEEVNAGEGRRGEGEGGDEHMICGPKDPRKTKIDGKQIGFPFDRDIDFPLGDHHSFMAATKVKIIHASEDKLIEIGQKLVNRLSEHKDSRRSTTRPNYRPRPTTKSPPRWWHTTTFPNWQNQRWTPAYWQTQRTWRTPWYTRPTMPTMFQPIFQPIFPQTFNPRFKQYNFFG